MAIALWAFSAIVLVLAAALRSPSSAIAGTCAGLAGMVGIANVLILAKLIWER